jgi:PAS domain S-box-containing protein
MEQISSGWTDNFSGAITICDTKGIILYMNRKAIRTFEKYGGEQLIGTNLLDCHPEPAKTKLQEMLRDETSNIYTIEKGGIRKLIHQSPWYKNNKYAGFVELSIELPGEMPNFIRG